MKILIMGASDSGGGCYFWADAINKYTCHEAVSARWYGNYIGYPTDFHKPDKGTVERLIKWCDVLHIRDSLPKHAIEYERLVEKKVITFTGMWYRKNHIAVVKKMKDRGYFPTVSTNDLQLYLPNNPPMWLPNAREEMVPTCKHKVFTVCHSPTYRARKGTYSIIDACTVGKIKLDLIENERYITTIKRKAKSHLVIDQFWFGYGNSAIEAWAMGIPAIGGSIEEKYNRHHAKKNNGDLPYYKCVDEHKAILHAIEELRSDTKLYNEYIERGREFFFTYHHSPVVAKNMIALYRSL